MLCFTELYVSAYLLIIQGSKYCSLTMLHKIHPPTPKSFPGKKPDTPAFIDFVSVRLVSFVADKRNRVTCRVNGVWHVHFKIVAVSNLGIWGPKGEVVHSVERYVTLRIQLHDYVIPWICKPNCKPLQFGNDWSSCSAIDGSYNKTLYWWSTCTESYEIKFKFIKW